MNDKNINIMKQTLLRRLVNVWTKLCKQWCVWCASVANILANIAPLFADRSKQHTSLAKVLLHLSSLLAQRYENGITFSRTHVARFALLLVLMMGSVNVWGEDVQFFPTDYTDQGSTSGGSATATKNGVTIASTKANPQSSTAHVREYQNGTITISSTSNITKIVFTSTANGNSDYGPKKLTATGYSGSTGKTGTWTGKSKSITFTCSKQFRWTQIDVTCEATTHTVTASGNNTTWGTVDVDGTIITATPAEGYRVSTTTPYEIIDGTATVSQNGNVFTVTPETDCNVQINFEVIPEYIITWSIAGSTSTPSVAEGTILTPPTVADGLCGDKIHVGWSSVEILTGSEKNETNYWDKGSALPAVTRAVTYYAVFAEPSGNSETFTLSLTKDDEIYYVGARVNDKTYLGVATDEASAAEFRMESADTEGSYYIYSVTDAMYIGGTGGDTKMSFSTITGDNYIWVYDVDAGTGLSTFKRGDRYLGLNNDRFSTYTSSYSHEFTLTFATSYSNYSTKCKVSNTLAYIDQSVELNEAFKLDNAIDNDKLNSWGALTYDFVGEHDGASISITDGNYYFTGTKVGTYTIRASQAEDDNTQATTVEFTICVRFPEPTGLRVADETLTDVSAVLSWDAVTGATGYTIHILSDNTADATIEETYTTTDTHYDLSDLTSEKYYVWGVIATNGTECCNSAQAVGDFTTKAVSYEGKWTFDWQETVGATEWSRQAFEGPYSPDAGTGEYTISNFTIPNGDCQFTVGYQGEYDKAHWGGWCYKVNFNSHMPLANYRDWGIKPIPGEGAVGTLHIHGSYADDNKYIGFKPNGYSITYGIEGEGYKHTWVNVPFAYAGNNADIWETAEVTISEYYNSESTKYYTGITKADPKALSAYCVNKSNTTFMNALHKNLAVGVHGIFRMHDTGGNAEGDNFRTTFIPFYNVLYHDHVGNVTGSSVYISSEKSDEERNIKLMIPERYGYTFRGWAHTQADAEAGTVNIGPNDWCKLWEPNAPLYPVWQAPILTITSMELLGFTYDKGNGPSIAQPITITGEYIKGIIKLIIPYPFEACTTEDGTYTDVIELSATDGEVNQTIYIRLQAGLEAGECTGVCQVETEGVEPTQVQLKGIVNKRYFEVAWMNNGAAAEGEPTTLVEDGFKVTALPETPDAPKGCSKKVFMGWTDAAIVDADGEPTITDEAPEILFTDPANSPAIKGNTTFYAVFADENIDGEGNISEVAEGTYYISHTRDEVTYYLQGQGDPVAVTDKKLATRFNVVKSEDGENYIFYVSGKRKEWLYSTNSNDGVRIGDGENDLWAIEAGVEGKTGVFNIKNTETTKKRYLTLYNKADFRTYDSPTATNRKENSDLEYAPYYDAYTTKCEYDEKKERTVRVHVSMAEAGTAAADCGAETVYEGNSTTLRVTNVNEGYAFVNWTIDGENIGGATIEPADALESTLTVGTEDVEVTANFRTLDKYTITWRYNHKAEAYIVGNPTPEVLEGGKIITLPTPPEAPVGCVLDKMFVGWTASEGYKDSPQKNAPSDLFTTPEGAPEITGNTTFHAVFASASEYTKITSVEELTDGTYLIVSESKNVAMGAQNGNYRNGVEVTIIENAIKSLPEGAAEVTIEAGSSAGTFALKVTDGYLYWTGTNYVYTGETSYDWNIAFSDGDANITSAETPTRKLQWNAGSPRFACYTSNQTAIQLYKKSSPGYTTYCDEADIVVDVDKTVTVTKDITAVNLIVNAGGKLKVSENTKLEVNSVTLRSEGDKVPQLVLPAATSELNVENGKLYFTKRLNNDRNFFFTLPFTCQVSDIYIVDNTENKYKYRIIEYDGAHRAEKGSGGTIQNWKVSADTELQAGKGYGLAVNTKNTVEVVFPMDISSTTLHSSDNTKKDIPITAHGLNADGTQVDEKITCNNLGWNFVGNPYLRSYGTLVDTDLRNGKIEIIDGFGGDKWLDETNLYVNLPEGDDNTYKQYVASAVTLSPFFPFFVQAAYSGTLEFIPTTRVPAFLTPRYASHTAHEGQPLYAGITLSNGAQSDQTTLVIGNQFTQDYEIGYDLEKMLGLAQKPQLYVLDSKYTYAFKALNEQDAANANMLGVYLPAEGEYTFDVMGGYDLSGVQAIYLTDNMAEKTVNLLEAPYMFTNDKEHNTTRFALSVVRKPETTTDLGNVQVAWSVWQDAPLHISLQGLMAGDIIRVVDATGRLVDQLTATESVAVFDLPAAGGYCVQTIGINGMQMKKIVVR